jgi:hypothetical protein
LNAERVVGIRQTETRTAEPFVPEPSISEAEDAIAKLKRYKSPDADQIPAKLIQAGRETLHSEIHKFIKSIRKNCLTSGRNQLLYPFTKEVIN